MSLQFGATEMQLLGKPVIGPKNFKIELDLSRHRNWDLYQELLGVPEDQVSALKKDRKRQLPTLEISARTNGTDTLSVKNIRPDGVTQQVDLDAPGKLSVLRILFRHLPDFAGLAQDKMLQLRYLLERKLADRLMQVVHDVHPDA